MRKLSWKQSFALAATVLVAGILGVATVQGGKPPAPSAPPVLYNIQFWYAPAPYTVGDMGFRKLNKSGRVVGSMSNAAGEQHGFLYDRSRNRNTAVDLNAIYTVPQDYAGWVIASASDINDNGVIAGYLMPLGQNVNNYQNMVGYVVDTASPQGSAVTVLPAPPASTNPPAGGWPKWAAFQINNHGDILVGFINDNQRRGMYIQTAEGSTIDQGLESGYASGCRMNIHLQVSGNFYDSTGSLYYYRWDAAAPNPDGTPKLDPIPGTAYDINDWGWVCGIVGAKSGGSYPCRYDFTNSLTVFSGSKGSALAINTDADLFCSLSGKGYNSSALYVYQNTLLQFYSVDSLINPTDLVNAAAWSGKSDAYALDMNDRVDSTNPKSFGQLAGFITFADGSQAGYLLTPTVPPPPTP